MFWCDLISVLSKNIYVSFVCCRSTRDVIHDADHITDGFSVASIFSSHAAIRLNEPRYDQRRRIRCIVDNFIARIRRRRRGLGGRPVVELGADFADNRTLSVIVCLIIFTVQLATQFRNVVVDLLTPGTRSSLLMFFADRLAW